MKPGTPDAVEDSGSVHHTGPVNALDRPRAARPHAAPTRRRELDASWLVRLRWFAAAGQAATILVAVRVAGMDLPVAQLLGLVTLGAAGNLLLAAWLRRHTPAPSGLIAVVMAGDIILLTALLALSGGAANPFSTLYLVYLALATLLLEPRWAWTLLGLAAGCFGILFLGGDPHHMHQAMSGDLHLRGMWVAFALGGAFIVYFGDRIRRQLDEREAQLERARLAATRADQLAALTTLAAGAAHELATPLSTIAIAARELERRLARNVPGTDSLEDAELIRGEVERCRGILARLGEQSGSPASGKFELCAIEHLLHDAIAELPGDRIRIRLPAEIAQARVAVPREALGQALRSVARNALQASGEAASVEIRGDTEGPHLRIEIRDEGCGMSEEVVRRAGEPFFTTREPGEGMGLGLFLARSVVERLGGRLDIDSTAGQGTRASLLLPRAGMAAESGGDAEGPA